MSNAGRGELRVGTGERGLNEVFPAAASWSNVT
jgi:hypothetical protein